jgi:hypothetical protein
MDPLSEKKTFFLSLRISKKEILHKVAGREEGGI